MAEPRFLTRFVPASFDRIRRVLFVQLWTGGMVTAALFLFGSMVADGYVSWFIVAMMPTIPMGMWAMAYVMAVIHARLGITPSRPLDDDEVAP